MPELPSPRTLGRSRIRWLAWALLVVLALASGLAMLRSVLGERVPALTRTEFAVAWQRWEQAAPANYTIEIEVSGRQAAVYRVEVRAGEVISASHNGTPLPNRRTWFTWSVPGMFETMEGDLRVIEGAASNAAAPQGTGPVSGPATGNAANSPSRLTLRAEFDPRYGFPSRYQRFEWGAKVDAQWRVREFVPVLENGAAGE